MAVFGVHALDYSFEKRDRLLEVTKLLVDHGLVQESSRVPRVQSQSLLERRESLVVVLELVLGQAYVV